MKYISKYIHKGHDRAEAQVIVEQQQQDRGGGVTAGGMRTHAPNHPPASIPSTAGTSGPVPGAAQRQNTPQQQQQQQHQQQQQPPPIDEVKQYLDGRYVSAVEACWRLLAFPLHAMQPSVVRLPVHLEGEQQLYFPADANPTHIANQPLPPTHLTAFFDHNRALHEAAVDAEVHATNAAAAAAGLGPDSPEATTAAQAAVAAATLQAAAVAHTYQDVCEACTWDGRLKQWRPRQRAGTRPVGRMYMCSPAAGERYYLRLLLSAVRGPQSFAALRIVNGVEHSTFKEAAAAHGLIADEGVWDMALTEAAHMQMPAQLRQMFADMLLFDPPACSAQDLWDRHRLPLCEDILAAARVQQHEPGLQLSPAIEEDALRHLQRIVEDGGKTLSALGMREPAAAQQQGMGGAGHALIHEHSGAGQQAALLAQVQQQHPMLNEQQRTVYDTVMAAVQQGVHRVQGFGGMHASNAFFLDSPGGCGKTFLLNLLLAGVRSQGRVALATASSGIAALLLRGGRTAHSMLKIPIPIQADSECRISADSELAALLRVAALLVWDEAPMMHQHCFLAVSTTWLLIRQMLTCGAPNSSFDIAHVFHFIAPTYCTATPAVISVLGPQTPALLPCCYFNGSK